LGPRVRCDQVSQGRSLVERKSIIRKSTECNSFEFKWSISLVEDRMHHTSVNLVLAIVGTDNRVTILAPTIGTRDFDFD